MSPPRCQSLLRLAPFYAIAAPACWYLWTADLATWMSTDSHGLYEDSFDAHGLHTGVSRPSREQSANALAICASRVAVGVAIVAMGVAMHQAFLRFGRVGLVFGLAAPVAWYFFAAGTSDDSAGLYTHSMHAHGIGGSSDEQGSNAVAILVGRVATGTIILVIGALTKRFLSRVGIGRARFNSRTSGVVGLAVPTWRPDIPLMLCFAVWYYGNYQHNICNKLALQALGGAEGFPLTIATCQLGVGVLYAVFLWIAPDARERPTITVQDWVATLPVSLAAAGAHAGSVFALSAGALSFGQIVKSCEPAFAALIGTLFYGATVSLPRWLCLVPIIGGVALSSAAELDFAWAALGAASLANVFGAIRGMENKKLLETAGVKDRLGSVGNQYAITTINAFIFIMPVALYREGHKLHLFFELCQSNRDVFYNILLSGWWFYIYNEVATIIIKKTGPVTQSIANTAKRAVIIVLGAIVLGESLNAWKLIGCAIAIGGVFLYSEIDKLVRKHKPGSSSVELPLHESKPSAPSSRSPSVSFTMCNPQQSPCAAPARSSEDIPEITDAGTYGGA